MTLIWSWTATVLDKLSDLFRISDMEEKKQSLGSFLRAARERRGLALRAVERACGVSNAYLSQLESGKIRQPSPLVLHKLAELYEVPYGLMLERAGYPAPTAETGTSGTMIVDSRLGPINSDEEVALKEYLRFLRSRRMHGEGD
jgi:HTH-type transcriptional regulator, competence development regulator